VTEITVKNETDTGAAVIEIRGLATTDTRFRIYDISADKYLTKRGWTKTPSALPGEAVLGGDVITIALDADLARKVSSRASLSLEQPTSSFREVFLWPEYGVPAVPEGEPSLDEPIAVEAALADLGSIQPGLGSEDDVRPEKPETVAKPDSAGKLAGGGPERRASPQSPMADLIVDDQHHRSWLPTMVAAALFLVLGFGLAYFIIGSSRQAQVQSVAQAVEAQRTKDQAEHAKKLAAAEQSSSKAAAAKIAEAGAKSAELTEARDAALKAVTEKEDAVRELTTKLTAATTELESYKATGQKIDARVAELTSENQLLNADRDAAFKTVADKDAAIKDLQQQLDAAAAESEDANALKASLEKARADLTAREQVLRDVQSKLEVANVQIDALKTMAGKNSEAGMEKSALEDKIAQLTADLDAARKSGETSKAQLTELNGKLAAAESKLAAPSTAQGKSDLNSSDEVASNETTSQLQEERDLYAKELKTLTDNFTALKTEKEALEKSVASLKQGKAEAPATADAPEAPQVLWGATSIDMSGAIYASNNQPTKKAAQSKANAKCRSQSDFGCKAMVTFQNSCFSVARFDGEGPATDNYGYSVHPNWRRAAAEALGRCERRGQMCTIRFTSCSPDSLSKTN
jgi:hypothetical protein